jgi:hypothetical protein
MKKCIVSNPIITLQRFPYIGPVTAFHLAKNLGADVGKPDRHLLRMSERLGFDSVAALCETVAHESGEKAKVVDLVIWRYLADHSTQSRGSLLAGTR